MTERETETRHFEEAARHVSELEAKIARQESLVARLDRDGHDTIEALRLLQTFRDLLVQARTHEGLTAERLRDLKASTAEGAASVHPGDGR